MYAGSAGAPLLFPIRPSSSSRDSALTVPRITVLLYNVNSLRAQGSAQSLQRLDNLRRPLRDLVLSQGALARLERGPQQHRILARRDRAAAKDFHRHKAAQFA